MSLQAMEAVFVELNSNGQVISEKRIALELVQRGDVLKVNFCVASFHMQFVAEFSLGSVT